MKHLYDIEIRVATV